MPTTTLGNAVPPGPGRTSLDAAATARASSPLQPTADFPRSSQVRSVLYEMASSSKNGGASSVQFLPSKDLKVKAWAFNYHTGLPKEMNVLREPKDGVVRGTICINVSGHDWSRDPSSVERYAKSNTYNVRVTLPDGQKLEWQNIPRTCVGQGKPDQAEYATAIDIQFPYQKGKTVVEAWPSGSAGVGGYIEGRRYHFNSADQPYDADAAKKAAAEQDRQNPPTDNRPSRRPYVEIG